MPDRGCKLSIHTFESVHAHTHTHIHTHTHAHTHTYTYAHTHTRTHLVGLFLPVWREFADSKGQILVSRPHKSAVSHLHLWGASSKWKGACVSVSLCLCLGLGLSMSINVSSFNPIRLLLLYLCSVRVGVHGCKLLLLFRSTEREQRLLGGE